MAVHYERFARVHVSGRWNTVLRRARRAGVRFRVNSGHRTMREQWRLFRENMIRPGVPKPGHPMTAVPSPFAPHIRSFRANHALDVDMFHGDGVQGLVTWLRKHGADPMFTVPGEGWHIELSRSDLRMLWRKFR